MSTLLQVATRCGDNLMLLEDYLAREVLDSASDPTAPRARAALRRCWPDLPQSRSW